MQWFHKWRQQIKKYRLVSSFAVNHQFASRGGSHRGKRDDSSNFIASTVSVLYMESYIVIVIIEIKIFELCYKWVDPFQPHECAVYYEYFT
jgi:hypothetical protein